MSELLEKQQKFTIMVMRLIVFAENNRLQLTFGEAYRSPETAELYARQGKGIKNSLHCQRLAIDFNLFKNGKYLTATSDYEILGEFWEKIGGSWGGRFSKPDGNHFSLEHNGVK